MPRARTPVCLILLAVLITLTGCGAGGDDGGGGGTTAREGGDDVGIASVDADCADADRRPEARADERFRSAVACLLDAERSARGLVTLQRDDVLAEAAQAHSDDMAERSYFAHASPDGEDVGDRARAAGYTPRPPSSWRVGENLGYGTGRLATPRRMMRGWMESEGHRANILRDRFRDVGVGVAFGSPDGERPSGALATTVFGAR